MNIATRRTILRTAVAALALFRPFDLQASEHNDGCCIQPDGANRFHLNMGSNLPRNGLSQDEVLAALDLDSGISIQFEEALGRVLAMISRSFGQRPGFGFYDDGLALNAYALDTTAIEGTSGTVAFGRNMLHKQVNLDPDGISVAAICAHEFAHILQFKTHWNHRLVRTYPRYCRELHADYLAGFFLYWFQQERSDVRLWRVGKAWEDMGPSEFTDDSSHGTARMRLDTIQRGYFDADEFGPSGVHAAAESGFDYVGTHAPLPR